MLVAAFVGMEVKVGQILGFTLQFLLLEILKQFERDIGALIGVELYEVFHTVVNDLVHLEQ